jgi:general stress protein 26
MTDLIDAVKATIEPVNYCFLTTIGPDGQPSTRLMQPFKPQADMTIWFGTHPQSRKAEDIRRDNRITVAYLNEAENAYVSLMGTARLESALEEREARWFEMWEQFFIGGPAGDNYVLVEFTPQRIEIMNFQRGVAPPPFGLKTADLIREGDHWREA